MTTTLLVKSRYRNGRVDWAPGRIDSFPDAQAALLMRDAPGIFEVVDPEVLAAAEAARTEALAEALGVNQEFAVEVDESPEEDQPETEGAVDEDSGVDEVDLDSMSLPEIREYAATQSISLQGLRRKTDIIAAIRGE